MSGFTALSLLLLLGAGCSSPGSTAPDEPDPKVPVEGEPKVGFQGGPNRDEFTPTALESPESSNDVRRIRLR